MRELKFRVYAKVKDDDGCFGYLETRSGSGIDFFYDGGWRGVCYFMEFPKVFIVEQYICRDDSSGKDIFMGDIIKGMYEYEYEEPWGGFGSALGEFIGYVDYDVEEAQYIARCPDLYSISKKKTFSEIRLNRTDVIGNMLENPELLKCKEN